MRQSFANRFSSRTEQASPYAVRGWLSWGVFICLVLGPSLLTSPRGFPLGGSAWGQASDPINDDDQIAALANQPPAEIAPGEVEERSPGIDLITLAKRGGLLMWPIGVMSILVVALAVERLVSFRRTKMVPGRLVRRLSQLMKDGGGQLDAEAAMVACRENRSAAATVISAMLMRTGRPLGEIEQAGHETAQRQADDHAGPIRWLNLAAAATPLMGLLGTVWGMIVAFHESSNLTSDRSRSEQLSEGIYTALVTTLAGLAVAIPAAIFAQYLENRLTKLFHRIENLAFSVAPSLEHYAGRMRMESDARLRPVDKANERSGTVVVPPVIARGSEGELRTRGASETTASKR